MNAPSDHALVAAQAASPKKRVSQLRTDSFTHMTIELCTGDPTTDYESLQAAIFMFHLYNSGPASWALYFLAFVSWWIDEKYVALYDWLYSIVHRTRLKLEQEFTELSECTFKPVTNVHKVKPEKYTAPQDRAEELQYRKQQKAMMFQAVRETWNRNRDCVFWVQNLWTLMYFLLSVSIYFMYMFRHNQS